MQLALIVDDSKTARFSLTKMLESFNINVNAVESAEAALEYLESESPDMIFMDHMMPGMDGFDAVKAIKANPDRSAIPIIMHTTKDGHIYRGQAKALGASDILVKPANNESLQSVLDYLSASQIEEPEVASEAGIDEPEPAPPSEVDSAPPGQVAAAAYQTVDQPQSANGPLAWVKKHLLILCWALLTLWLLIWHFLFQQQLQQAQEKQTRLMSLLEWGINQQRAYDYGERPLSGDRLVFLERLVEQLGESGFKGKVIIEGHIGAFCLASITLADGSDALMLPEPELPLSACEVIGVSSFEEQSQSVAESTAFSLYKQSFDGSDGISLEIRGVGTASPLEPYPEDLTGITTGDWNTAALANNRVLFFLEPES